MRSISAGSASKQHRKKIRKLITLGIAIVCLVGGLYLLGLALTPQVTMAPTVVAWNEPVNHTTKKITEDRLYIPKLKLNITYKAGGVEVLDNNAWHRYPERGDPEKGGNFILAAHRFEIGLTPGETRRQSPFYYLNTLEPGDKIYADFNGKRYEYEVIKKFSVKPTALEIENPSEEPVMTLYTCTLEGEKDGREVIRAKRIGIDIDPAKKF